MLSEKMLLSSEVAIVKKDGEYYVVKNKFTDDVGKVYFEVVCELIEKADSFFMCDYEDVGLTSEQKNIIEGSD